MSEVRRKALLFSLALLVMLAFSNSGKSQTTSVALEPGESIEQKIAGGETHTYSLTIPQGTYTLVEVDQRGISVSVTILSPEGEKLRVADLTHTGTTEEISLIAEKNVTYRVEVLAPGKQSFAAGYAIRLREWRAATAPDKSRVEAELLLEKAVPLLQSQNEKSRLEALEKFQQSLTLWQALKDPTNEARTFFYISYAYHDLGKYQEVLEAAEQGLKVAQASGNRFIQPYLLDMIGLSYNGRGQRKKALDYFLQALPLRSEKDPVGLAMTLSYVGLSYSWIGERAKALTYMERAAKITHDIGERVKESTELGNMCVTLNYLSQYKKALERCNEALKIKLEVGDDGGRASVLNSFGAVYSNLGDYQKSLDYYLQARALHKISGNKEGEGVTTSNIAFIYGTLGEYQKAIDTYTEALVPFRELEYTFGIATALSNMGVSYASLKNYRKALELHLEVLPLRPEENDRDGRAITFSNIANCYVNLGDKQKALDYYTQALALYRAGGNQRQYAITVRNVGVFYRDEGQTEKALEFLNEARRISGAIGDRNNEAAALSHLGKLELSRGNFSEARKLIEQAIVAIESIRVSLKSQQLRASFMAAARTYYESDIEVLMRLHEQQPAEGFAAAGLQASEKSRARSLLELLREARAEIRTGVDPALIERETNLRRSIADRAEQQTRLLSVSHTDEQAAAAAKEIEALTTDYDQVQTRIRQTSPRYASLVEPAPISVEGIQKQVVDENTLLLEYALGEQKSFVWAVTPDSVKAYELPGRAIIESAAKRFYQLLTERGLSVSAETLAQRKQRLDKADSEYPRAANDLSRMLLGPIAAELKQKRLVFVAEGVLQYVPFSALPLPDGDISRPLIVDHEIVTLPSASVLALLREEFANRQPASRTLAVMADPVFSASDARLAHASAAQDNSGFIDAQRSASESGLGDLVRLRFSRLEADEIVRLAGDKRNLKALDFSANRSLVTDSTLRDYRIVHFATHGLINNQHPDLSGVVLSLVDEQGRPQNGFLRLYDIYNLKLDADLVVLSACQTALGKEIKGEGLVGLTRGFMYAGAPRVVASLWRIDDRASADVMRRFYQAMLKDGLRPAAALRAAQVSMLREKRWQSPHYWAAFTLQGEWR